MFKTPVSTFSSHVEHKKRMEPIQRYIQVTNTTTKSMDYTS